MSALTLFGTAFVVIAGSGFASLLFRKGSLAGQRVATILLVSGCAAGGAVAASVLLGPDSLSAEWAWQLPSGTVRLAIDRLSAFFLLPVFLVSALGSIYGEGYWPAPAHPDNARKLRCFYGVATAGLVLVMIAGDAWTFLVGWELVGLAAFFLVTTEQDDAQALRAGWIYLIATHTATLVLFAMFGLLREATGTWLLVRSATLGTSALVAPILLLALVGFGIKAGVMPFHVWLPGAHAAAPSHVSAFLSGIVLKVGIYGLVRTLALMPVFPVWLGPAMLALGVVSGVMGVVLALAQHDLKRLLAYHSVENIGIILIGLGVGVLGVVQHRPGWAALGFAGGLLHVWNHAVFKSLLFYAAGSVIRATGTRDLEGLGGLLRRMRFTGTMFLVGAAAICGLPPLNGFVSEWLISVGSFRSLVAARDGPTAMAALGAPALAFIGALAVACFIKAFAAVFLGSPRGRYAGGLVEEASAAMKWSMGVLAATCVAIGLLPLAAGRVSYGAARILLGGVEPPLEIGLSGLAQASLILVAILAAAGVATALSSPRSQSTFTWDCGYAMPTARMQYSASSFAQMLGHLFRRVLFAEVHRPSIDSPFPRAGARFESHVPDPVLDRLILPATERGQRGLGFVRAIQTGHIQMYLVYIVVTLVVLLAWSSAW
ncbi:MAG: proton-conducting transporter membrane subunit [Syntrophomonadaceae bacterium]